MLHGQTGWASTRRRSFPSQSPGPCSCGQPQLSGLRDFLSPHLFMRPSSGLLSMCLLLPATCVYPPAVPNSPPPPPPPPTLMRACSAPRPPALHCFPISTRQTSPSYRVQVHGRLHSHNATGAAQLCGYVPTQPGCRKEGALMTILRTCVRQLCESHKLMHRCALSLTRKPIL